MFGSKHRQDQRWKRPILVRLSAPTRGVRIGNVDIGGRKVAGETRETAGGIGLTLGGAIVIAGIVVAIFWSVLWGVILALVGLVFFGGFARGRWY
jgi:hypothetical protein